MLNSTNTRQYYTYESIHSSLLFLPPPALVHVLPDDILDVLLLVVLRDGRRLAVVDVAPFLEVLLLGILFGVVAAVGSDYFVLWVLGVGFSSGRYAVLFACRLMLYLTDSHVSHVWCYLIRREVQRLLRRFFTLPGLLLRLRGRLPLFLDLNITSQVDKLPEGVRNFGLKILILLHFAEMMLQVKQYTVKLGLICLFARVKFNYPALEDGDEVDDEAVVGLLLLAGCEA